MPINVAVSGVIPANAETASDVLDLALASRYLPRSTNDISNELLSNDAINLGRSLPEFAALYSTAAME